MEKIDLRNYLKFYLSGSALVTVQYRWRILQKGRWVSVKGDHDRFIEVKIIVLKGKITRLCQSTA